MKRTTLALGFALGGILATGILLADALPMDWFRKRNGLTDAQVDDIFERNPNAVLRLSRGKWMELKYRLHRFDNMKDWLNMQIQGKLGDEILRVSDTNEILVANNAALRVDVARWHDAAEKWQDVATNNAARVERVTAALDERRAECVEKRDTAVLPSTKAIYQEFIYAIDRIKENLNAGGNE